MWIAVQQNASTVQRELLLFDTDTITLYYTKLNTKTRELHLEIEKLEKLGRGSAYPLSGQSAVDFLQQLHKGLHGQRETIAARKTGQFLRETREFYESLFNEEAVSE